MPDIPLLNRRYLPNQAKVCSTIHPLAGTLKPLSVRLTILKFATFCRYRSREVPISGVFRTYAPVLDNRELASF